MPPVKIVSLRQLDPLDIVQLHRPDHGVDGELVVEILVEITVAAEVIMGAGPKIDSPLHVVQAGPP
jgi:hypothetical protein